MAVRRLEPPLPDSRKNVAMRDDPSRIDPRKLKLGKQAARHDPRTLLLASYVTPALPTPPAAFDLTAKVKSCQLAMASRDRGADTRFPS